MKYTAKVYELLVVQIGTMKQQNWLAEQMHWSKPYRDEDIAKIEEKLSKTSRDETWEFEIKPR